MDHKYAPELPDDVLHSVVRRLSSLVCFAAFRSVCRSWRLFFLQHYSYLVPPPPPWWMLPANSAASSHPTVYSLYGFEDQNQFYHCKIPDNFEIFVASSGTWLAFIDNKGRKLRLLNPLSLIHISLPFLRETGFTVYEKVIVSCTGPLIKNDEDVLFGLVYDDNKLAYMKLGDKEWTIIEIDPFPSPSTKIEQINDLVFYQGKFYFVNQAGTIFVCEENFHAPHNHDPHYCHPVKAMKLIDPVNVTSREKPTPNADVYMYYLVEVEGKLMLVIWFSTSNAHLGSDFRVFKIDFSKKSWEVVRRRDLEDFSLFLNYCYGTVATKVRGRNGIYFKRHEKAEGELHNHKVMIYDYLKEMPTCTIISEVTKLHRDCLHPIWIIPRHTDELETKRGFSFFWSLFLLGLCCISVFCWVTLSI